MVARFYRCSMLAVFPESTFTILPPIVFLANPAGNDT